MQKIIIFFFLVLFSTYNFSQIVNVEKKRKENTTGFQGTITGEFNLRDVGSKILEFKNDIDLQYSRNAHSVILLNNIRLLNVDSGNLINGGFQHLRYNYTIKDSSFVTLEIFGQNQYNDQKLLERRVILGAGPRFRVFKRTNAVFFIAPLVMYEYERLSDEMTSETSLTRLDLYSNFYMNISDKIKFSNIIYYQPAFSNFDNYKISGEASLQFSFSKHLAFGTSLAFDYNSQPPVDVQDLFYYWKNKLIVKF